VQRKQVMVARAWQKVKSPQISSVGFFLLKIV